MNIPIYSFLFHFCCYQINSNKCLLLFFFYLYYFHSLPGVSLPLCISSPGNLFHTKTGDFSILYIVDSIGESHFHISEIGLCLLMHVYIHCSACFLPQKLLLNW